VERILGRSRGRGIADQRKGSKKKDALIIEREKAIKVELSTSQDKSCFPSVGVSKKKGNRVQQERPQGRAVEMPEKTGKDGPLLHHLCAVISADIRDLRKETKVPERKKGGGKHSSSVACSGILSTESIADEDLAKPGRTST